MKVLKYLIDKGLSINNWNKTKPPMDFLWPDKEFDEILFKKWKPVYEIQVPENVIKFMRRETTEFDINNLGPMVNI